MTTLIADLEGLDARGRERLMLVVIGRIARGEVTVADVSDERDLRQMAYLSSLARNRVRHGGDRLTAFFKQAMSRLREMPAPPMASQDPLQKLLGAIWPLDAGKVRSEADLHVQLSRGAWPQVRSFSWGCLGGMRCVARG